VHGAAASAVASGGLAGQFGEQQPRRHALRQRVAVSSVRARNPVVPPEVRHHAGGHSLLADIEVRETGDLPIPDHYLECQFRLANQN
jgi:hypothetical protein